MKITLQEHIEQVSEAELSRLVDQLPAWRRQVALKYRHLAGKRESTLAFLLLQQAFRQQTGQELVPPFAYGEHGKPYIPSFPDFHFNLSHCRTAVVCVVHEGPVGVDVECPRKVSPSLIRYTMNATEQAQISAASCPEQMFVRLWTRKEAILKLTGEGVGSGMHDVLLPEGLLERHIKLETYEGEGCVYSVACYA